MGLLILARLVPCPWEYLSLLSGRVFVEGGAIFASHLRIKEIVGSNLGKMKFCLLSAATRPR